MMEDDEREWKYRDYTAVMLGNIAQAIAGIGGSDWKAPSYMKMMYPEKKDTRTAAEIKAHILEMLD